MHSILRVKHFFSHNYKKNLRKKEDVAKFENFKRLRRIMDFSLKSFQKLLMSEKTAKYQSVSKAFLMKSTWESFLVGNTNFYSINTTRHCYYCIEKRMLRAGGKTIDFIFLKSWWKVLEKSINYGVRDKKRFSDFWK